MAPKTATSLLSSALISFAIGVPSRSRLRSAGVGLTTRWTSFCASVAPAACDTITLFGTQTFKEPTK